MGNSSGGDAKQRQLFFSEDHALHKNCNIEAAAFVHLGTFPIELHEIISGCFKLRHLNDVFLPVNNLFSVSAFRNRGPAKDKPAIFYQHAAAADDPKWDGNRQYPRIDYIVDMQENPARNASGVLSINTWCDMEYGSEPEDIDYTLRELLHATFAQADDYPYCLAWVRSDAFEAKVEKEQTTRTIGITTIFDIMACPSQYTMYPDPIIAMNDWTKQVLPDAVVIGHDEISGWVTPTKEKPVVYWRLASIGIQQRHFTHTWLNANIEGHVYAKTAADRLYNLVKLNTAQALTGHIPMEDTSPLFLKDYSCKPHLNYLSQGQIQAQGRFGILQSQSHFENRATGSKLKKTNIR